MKKNKPYPYRFKTEAEFIKEYGKQWWDKANWCTGLHNNGNNMMYMLGQVFLHYTFTPGRYTIGNNAWMIDTNMLTENIIKPNYKPRTLKI